MGCSRSVLSVLAFVLSALPSAFALNKPNLEPQTFRAESAGYVIEPPDILRIEVTGLPKKMPIVQGEHLVRPDGTVSLGSYGTVSVTGLSADDAQKAILKQVASQVKQKKRDNLQVKVEVSAYNSKVYYIITQGETEEQVRRVSMTGNETVLDALERNADLKGKRIWIARPPKEILPVDWQAITERGITQTNYQILPGDRLYIDGRKGNTDQP